MQQSFPIILCLKGEGGRGSQVGAQQIVEGDKLLCDSPSIPGFQSLLSDAEEILFYMLLLGLRRFGRHEQEGGQVCGSCKCREGCMWAPCLLLFVGLAVLPGQ